MSIAPGLASLMMVVHDSVTALPDERHRDVAPLVLEPYVAPHRPRRYRVVRGLFVVTVIDIAPDGRRTRHRFPPGDHDATRSLWRALQAWGYETTWHRAERVPPPPDGVLDAADLAEHWRSIATTPREQRSLL